jgi:hypothetical protein
MAAHGARFRQSLGGVRRRLLCGDRFCGECSSPGPRVPAERGEEIEEFEEFALLESQGEQILSDAIPRSSGSEANRTGCQQTRAVAHER